MNTEKASVPFEESDAALLNKTPHIVRLYNKETGAWFIGKLGSLSKNNGAWHLRMPPFFKVMSVGAEAHDPGDRLIRTVKDLVICLRRDDNQAFQLAGNPQKAMPAGPPPEVTVLEFNGHIAVLSPRTEDFDDFAELKKKRPEETAAN